ncbi:aquaporin-like protein [Marasmius fiardii PR-910]|nr:aquaporin-like protein [Marasmius fiardii PR-910]
MPHQQQGLALPRIIRLGDLDSRPPFLTVWERHRHKKAHWVVESFAEFLATFMYTYAGVGSQVLFIAQGIIPTLGTGLSSVQQIGWAYAFGVVFALAVCAPTSGGHFSPCITIALVLFKGFPALKGVRYIASQILGCYVACLLIYVQYKVLFDQLEAALTEAGKLDIFFTPQGPAGAFGLYLSPESSLGSAFLNEFITDLVMGMVIFGCIDPTSVFVPPVLLPFIIAMAYATAIWSYSVPGLAANTARDVGGRLAAMTIWGFQAHGGAYGAISALTNIPATLIAAFLYQIFMVDSARVVPQAHLENIDVHRFHGHNPGNEMDESNSASSTEKAVVETLSHTERV